MASGSSFLLRALANVYYGVSDYGMLFGFVVVRDGGCHITVAAFYCIQSNSEPQSFFSVPFSNMCAKLSKLRALFNLLTLVTFLGVSLH